jgi:transcriptional regulator with XRE-family HTH domain
MLYTMDEIKRMQQFGLILARRRQELGLSLEDVGKHFGASKQAVSQIECGKNKDIKGNTLFGLMKALKWSPEQLYLAYQGKDPMSATPEDQEAIFNQIEKLLKSRKASE